MKILLFIISITCWQAPPASKQKKAKKSPVKIIKTVTSPAFSMHPLTQFTNI